VVKCGLWHCNHKKFGDLSLRSRWSFCSICQVICGLRLLIKPSPGRNVRPWRTEPFIYLFPNPNIGKTQGFTHSSREKSTAPFTLHCEYVWYLSTLSPLISYPALNEIVFNSVMAWEAIKVTHTHTHMRWFAHKQTTSPIQKPYCRVSADTSLLDQKSIVWNCHSSP